MSSNLIHSRLFDSLLNPSGNKLLLPLKGCIGIDIEDALVKINEYARSNGFLVSH
jgi:hypothetical protein